MATITLKGSPIHTKGNLPPKGQKAPSFKLVNADLEEVNQSDLKGKKLVLNIFPSLDTSVCATSVRKFNEQASKLNNTVVLCISKDLPFAHKRFCSTEGLNTVVSLSGFRDSSFGDTYGVEITSGPLVGLYSRAVVVVDENGTVIHAEQVPEIAQEPDYDTAIKVLG